MDKKILVLLGVTVIAVAITIAMFVGNSGDEELGNDALSDNTTVSQSFAEVDERIKEIIKVEIEWQTLDSMDESYTENSKAVIEKLVKHLESLDKTVKSAGNSTTTNILKQWIDAKKIVYENALHIVTELEKLPEQSAEDTTAAYEKIIQLSLTIETDEMRTRALLLDYEVAKGDSIVLSNYYSMNEEEIAVNVISEKEEKTELLRPVINKGYLLPRGHADRLPLAIAICEHDGIPVEDLIFIRFMRSDGSDAFVIASPDYNPQLIYQYVCRKNGTEWTILSRYEWDQSVADLIREDFPMFNTGLLPEYDISTHDLRQMSEEKIIGIEETLRNNGYMGYNDRVNFISSIDEYIFIVTEKKVRIFAQISDAGMSDILILDNDREYSSFHGLLTNEKEAPVFIFIQD